MAIQPMKHEDGVRGAIFSHNGSLILSWSWDHMTRLWDINVDYDFPKGYLSLLLEMVTGTVMEGLGNIAVLSPEEWQKRKRTYGNLPV